MAQAKVSDYFGVKKRDPNVNPAKRRKVQLTDLEDDVKPIIQTASIAPVVSKKATIDVEKYTVSASSAKRSTRASAKSKGSSRKKNDPKKQSSIKHAFAKQSSESSDSGTRDHNSSITEEITSQWDEHDGPTPKTPKRKIRPMDTLRLYSESEKSGPEGTRRKSVARRSLENSTPQKIEEKTEERQMRQKSELALSFQQKFAMAEEPAGKEKPVGKELLDKVSESAMTSDDTITGDSNMSDNVKSLQKETASTSAEMEVDETTEAVKQSSSKAKPRKEKNIPAEVLRERLAKCGKLETLKAKLAEMNSTLKAVRKIEEKKKWAESAEPKLIILPPTKKATPVHSRADSTTEPKKSASDEDVSEKKAVPAYERHEHLARAGPPSLALPGKYQRLFDAFQGTETVVCMLHNRHEIITFSKLKKAVQNFTKKNFEEKALGQMKTVYPTAYKFRQEKGLLMFGNKTSGYQLTVEPNLEGLEKDDSIPNSDGKVVMSAVTMLRRKSIFRESLIDITKAHHADFLLKHDPPISIPQSKITRWHPRFKLDTVPDIEAAELPQPPVQVYQTAKQVLESARGKLPARVEAAMSNVAVKSEESKASTSSVTTTPAAASPKPVSSAYKGIPLSLLEKIRAKEAARTAASLTRDPKEDKKTKMMERLPSLIRSLRAYYVTEKKPALPMDVVVQKLADSYSSGISVVDVEAHLTLLQELVPSWLQVIQISRGKYVKIDKNTDIMKIINDINNLAKSRK